MSNEYNAKNQNSEFDGQGANQSESENARGTEESSKFAYKSVLRGQQNNRAFSVAALVLSILSFVFFFAPVVGLIFAVLGIGFSAYSRINLGYFDGLSLAGLIIGIFGVVFSVMLIIMANVLVNNVIAQWILH